MALCWESLATRDTKLLKRSLLHRHHLPAGTSWVNYLRCHDDVGWTFDDADAAAVGISAYDHRQFLNRFYTGQFPGSFARGVPFQENPDTGDMRISGTMASLAGLEQAIDVDDAELKEMAIRRILLLNSIILSIGGIPLLYLGEEWGMLNDYDFVKDPAKAGDTRWIHRPKMQWEFLKELNDDHEGIQKTFRGRIFRSLQKLIRVRKSLHALAGQTMELVSVPNVHLLCFLRVFAGHRLLVIANFSEERQAVEGNHLRTVGLGRFFQDALSQQTFATSEKVWLEPYQIVWLSRV
jgi:amylosucrase